MIRNARDDGRWTKRSFSPFVIFRLSSFFFRLSIIFCLFFSTVGCEAFVRKFTRKPKKEVISREEMVLAPVEYKAPEISKEKEYQQYFLYWKAWQDEFINSLFPGLNRRKQLECASETIKNLEQIRVLLKEESQRQLSGYIEQINELKDAIEKDAYGIIIDKHRLAAERIKRDIIREFSYNKIKSLAERSK